MTARQGCGLKDAAGFTLLEALIATALMAAIFAALATITAQWLPNWNRGFARLQLGEQLALALERLVADLAAAEFVSSGRASRQPSFDGAAHSVTFVRTVLSPNAGPGLENVRLAEISSEHGPLLVRVRAPFVPVIAGINERDQLHFTDPVVLIRSPIRLSFSYAGADRRWRDSWQGELQLPRAIKLTLRDTVSRETLAVSTATLIHVELPAECIVAKSLAGCWELLRPPPKAADLNAGRTQ